MRASAFEFRLRVVILVAIISVGFWSPRLEALSHGSRMSLLEWLSLELSRTGLLPFSVSTPAVILVASLIAAAGVVFRLWGTAYLGPHIVSHPQMKAGAVMAAGPYRYVRNPLYVGTYCMIAAMCFAMPTTGAVLVLVLVPLFLFRLILAEEAFLTRKLGEAYRDYCHAVPRVLPRLRGATRPSPDHPRWGRAMIAEINPIGVFFVMAVLSWRYDNALMVRAILVVFGVSLIARALVPADASQTAGA